MQQSTARTIVNPDRLFSEVERVRRRGWADAPEGLFTEINALAALIFHADGELFGTIAIVGSVHYLPTTHDRPHVDALLRAAADVSSTVRYTGSTAR